MFDPNIKVRILADFKYKDEEFLNANTYLSFDIYDSTKIAELITLYNPYYSHKEFIELPSIDSLPFHVKQQLEAMYSPNKPKDVDYLPVSDKPFYEVLGDTTFSPFGKSPYEDTSYDPKPLADNTYEPDLHEPTFIQPVAPSITEIEKDVEVKKEVETTINYSESTKNLLTLKEDELTEKSASEIKKAVAEIDNTYVYTNKVEAIKHLITYK